MFFKNKKILVAGGSGFVGVNLIQRLLDQGAQVTATLHKKDAVIKNDHVKYVRVDLEKPEDCKLVCEGIDHVFMCAANTSGAAVMEKTPLVHLTPNIRMNLNMLEAAYAAKIQKFLFISTNTVYPVAEHPVKEDEVATGDFFYKYFIVGWMKRFTEICCQMYAEKIKDPMKVVVVRPANMYGEFDDFEWETSHVIPALIRRFVERHKPVEVWGDGLDLKEFIYVQDFIDGMLLAMEKIDSFDPINIAVGKPCTVRDVINIIKRAANYEDAEIIYDATKPSMIRKRLIDPKKAKDLLGFEAKTSLEDGITKTVQWYREKVGK